MLTRADWICMILRLICLAPALSYVVAVDPSHAEVVYVVLPPLVIKGGYPASNVYLDLDQNGSEDIRFAHTLYYDESFWSNVSQATGPLISEQLIIFDNILPATRAMEAGTLIDANSGYWSYDGSLAYVSTYLNFGDWRDAEPHFMALRFPDENGQYLYAWIKAVVELGSHTTILEYAYETEPGIPVYAGLVPEPSAFSILILVGFGAKHPRRR